MNQRCAPAAEKPSASLGLAALCLWLGFAAAVQAGEWRESSLKVNGVERWYRFYAPPAPPKKSPVVLLLHGGTGSMRTIFDEAHGGTREWPALAERERFMLVVPNGTNGQTGNARGDRQN